MSKRNFFFQFCCYEHKNNTGLNKIVTKKAWIKPCDSGVTKISSKLCTHLFICTFKFHWCELFLIIG